MPKLRATVLLKCLFPMSGELSPFSATKKKISSFAISMAPATFLNNTISAVEFPLLFGMGDFGGSGGAVSFSRVYQALQSGCISDFTRGKSKPSAAVDWVGVELAH